MLLTTNRCERVHLTAFPSTVLVKTDCWLAHQSATLPTLTHFSENNILAIIQHQGQQLHNLPSLFQLKKPRLSGPYLYTWSNYRVGRVRSGDTYTCYQNPHYGSYLLTNNFWFKLRFHPLLYYIFFPYLFIQNVCEMLILLGSELYLVNTLPSNHFACCHHI